MRYWGWLAAKLLGVAFALRILWAGITRLLPAPYLVEDHYLGYDLPWTLAAGGLFLIGCGAVYLCLLDQRYRCRVCVRRLRMPIRAGSWGQMLQKGRPRIEYICTYGHGTLKVPELQISGLEASDWKAHQDMWTELALEDKQ